MNFWEKLGKSERPFFCLAPMEDVTDTCFRQIVMKAGRPDVFFTEFMNIEAFGTKGEDKVIHRLKYAKKEHPIVAQIWGMDLRKYILGIKKIKELGFDGVDINMACPEKRIIKNGACSALIKDPAFAKEIILIAKEAAGDMPVSVKTRIGFNNIQTEEWIGFLLTMGLDALTIHGRTRKEMSKVPAHWDEIGKAVKMRDEMMKAGGKLVGNKPAKKTLIIGNGDIKNREHGIEMAKKYGVDGIMIGRGIFHNLLAFKTGGADGSSADFSALPIKKRLKYALDHLELFDKTWDDFKNYEDMKKFLKMYIIGFEGANDLRVKLMGTKKNEEAQKILEELI
ncbi:MAG: dihydrouridine synthase DuS [Candidatus Peregrinibacteria bacterium GW2011_GWC2_39_14]|nr:MAG: tRNA-dihydrouridine synthase [Candidatus Peregrinibacteria bacterium GW2011_GWA2_38_36]KKR06564.1 MAG: dihydrouridine synthase DuS [Candidatus Peregrinibacteria bacterium GW2011_GWC2_39_14]